ncbi:hypothetical protein, partial [Guyparkeria sp.]|uniref:hypothetical protein n=1 Tax=Guyparkeria sp. TaxID=2035736 RepID=UPI003970B593
MHAYTMNPEIQESSITGKWFIITGSVNRPTARQTGPQADDADCLATGKDNLATTRQRSRKGGAGGRIHGPETKRATGFPVALFVPANGGEAG